MDNSNQYLERSNDSPTGQAADSAPRKGTTVATAGFSGIFDILELSPTLRQVYQAMLKCGDASVGEIAVIIAEPDTNELKTYLNLLSRLEYLEKYKVPDGVRFKLRGKMRSKSSLSDDVWNRLED